MRRLRIVSRRVTALESSISRLTLGRRNSCGPMNPMDDPTLPVLKQLQALAQDAKKIRDASLKREDYRTALASVRELTHILELIAKLGGELDEKIPANILNLNIDPETGKRIAEMYLARFTTRKK